MKRYYILFPLVVTAMALTYCSGGKKAAAKREMAKVVYANELQTVIVGNCSPCHIPEKGGKKKAYDNYANVKSDIDDIIRRIELNPHEKGFMPMRRETKLNDSTIAVFKKWKEDGMLEN